MRPRLRSRALRRRRRAPGADAPGYAPASARCAGSADRSPGAARSKCASVLQLEIELEFMLASRRCGMQMLERERERVAAAGHRLAAAGLVLGTAGNISERDGELVAITPTGAELAKLEPDD